MRSFAVVAAAAILAGCAGEEPGTWHGRDLAQTDPAWASEAIPVGGALELDYPRGRGVELAWDWFVDERLPLDFSVHTHRNGRDVNYVEGSFTDHAGSLVAEESGLYSLYWVNSGSGPVTLWHRTPEGAVRTSFAPRP